MPVYKYFGFPAKYHGKPLFHILSNLKNFGVGRIITRSSYETEDKPTVGGPSFYRILWVQPLMDQESLLGSVVAEKVVEYSIYYLVWSYVGLLPGEEWSQIHGARQPAGPGLCTGL